MYMHQAKLTWYVLPVAAILAFGVLGVLSAPAGASFIGDDVGALVDVKVTSGGETEELAWFFPKGQIVSGRYTWSLPEAAEVHGKSQGKHLGTITQITLQLDADPGVSLGFVVTAGASDTTFDIVSSLVPFTSIHNPLAYASAAVTVTDNTGDGAYLTGLFDANKAYEARYNSTPVVWAHLIDPVSVGVNDSVTASARKPASGRMTIFDDVSSIQSEYHFILSANDQASGTSRFDVIVPEPATMSLLALGAMVLIRRRRG
jgi:hypothetical protein